MTTVSDARARNYFSSVWSNRFIIAAIVQGAVITGLTLAFVAAQILTSGTNIIEFLSLSFEGPAKWIFLGYIFYMILIVSIATTSVFYNHFEVNMQRTIRGFRSVLAWVHLIGMNVGGATVTLTMIYAGLVGSGIIGIIMSGGNNAVELKPNTQVLEQFIVPISAFAMILVIGLIAGGLTLLLNFMRHKKKFEQIVSEV
ncbi:MAG: hypothetical protein M3146_07410 [Thermoproteota archaeon]|nr:hypothetical protein [Thermoproteota archaeon]